MSPHQRLATAFSQLGAEEREVLVLVAERLLMGQRQYGLLRLAVDGRNFAREAAEEAADGAIYAACALLRDELHQANRRERETGT